MGTKESSLAKRIEGIVESSPCSMGLSVRLVGKGSVLEIDSERPFALASVYKIPLMATLFHKAEEGEIDLGERLTLREEDKSLGANDLQFMRAGLNLTLHDLCLEMIVHSDNTATDMVHRRMGIEVPEQYMKELGLDSFDIYCPCREYYFLLLGWAGRFTGMPLKDIVSEWKGMTNKERIQLFEEIRAQNRHRSMKEAQRLATKIWGYADEKESALDRRASWLMDNHGSPQDVTKLLEMIVTNKITSKENTDQMLQYMLLCDSRDRLPARIPPTIRVANKTGTVPGTVNDCAIMFASKKNTVICTCLSDEVKYKDKPAVAKSMSEIGYALYEAYGK
jgi:beta-lactamase class A